MTDMISPREGRCEEIPPGRGRSVENASCLQRGGNLSKIIVGFRLSQSLNLTRRFPVALQNTIRLRYDLGDLATVSWEDWDRDLALYLVLTCRSPCCNWPRCLGPGSTTPATTINANLCNLVLGRKQCGLKLAELGALAGGIDYATVSNRLSEFEVAHSEDLKLKRVMKQALKYLEIRKI